MPGIVDAIRWRRSRLAAMDMPEIGHRISEQIARQSGRRFNKQWEDIPAEGHLVELPNVRCVRSEVPDAIKSRVAEQAQKTIVGKFELLGVSWTHAGEMPPAPAFWHLDAQGIPWSSPDKYCFDISHRAAAGREIKHVWEINRLQFLVPLAVHARLTGDTRIRTLIPNIVLSWMRGNRPYRGVNWTSGVELALRAISVAVALSILGLEQVETADRIDIERFFFEHLFWLRRYPSLHSSENNHRIAELAGSLVCATFAPGIDSEANLRRDLDHLMSQLEAQILPDGVGAEQSPTYAAFAIELALVAFRSLNVAPERLPMPVQQRLLAWVDHVKWISTPAGNVPMIGDCDDGKVVGLEGIAGPQYVASIAAWVSGYLNQPIPWSSRRHLDLRDVIFFPQEGSSTSPAARQPVGKKTWKVGGYSVWRKRPSDPIVLVFDHGPVGYLSIAAHGHADALSVWLSVGETPVIVDAGTYVYNSAPLWRERFRSSTCHNTLSISGVSSSSTSGPFNWTAKARARLGSASTADKVTAEHDGFLRTFGVRHRRSVSMSDEGRITVEDELIGGSDPLPVQISFLIHPRLSARTDNAKRSFIIIEDGDHPVAGLSCGDELQAHIAFGDKETGKGWVSPSFGVLNAAHQIVFEGLLSKASIIEIVPLG